MNERCFFSTLMTAAKFWRLKPGRTRLRAGMGPRSLDLTPKLSFSSTPPAVVVPLLSRRESHVRGCSLDQKRRQDLCRTRERSSPCGEEPRHGCAKRRDRCAAGSSGCGKTSTLRMIAGFEEVTRGEIPSSRAGALIRHRPSRRKVAMAFEGYSLYPPLTVRDNIAFALKSARMSAKDVQRSVADVARISEIEGILDRYPSSISGGEQQRASLARALVRQADLHPLDEPMGQLEPRLRAVLRGRLKSLLVDRRMTAIFVTHDQTEANALADRVAVMEGGVLQQFASQKDLRERPAICLSRLSSASRR